MAYACLGPRFFSSARPFEFGILAACLMNRQTNRRFNARRTSIFLLHACRIWKLLRTLFCGTSGSPCMIFPGSDHQKQASIYYKHLCMPSYQCLYRPFVLLYEVDSCITWEGYRSTTTVIYLCNGSQYIQSAFGSLLAVRVGSWRLP
jgi:hypothetical protein